MWSLLHFFGCNQSDVSQCIEHSEPSICISEYVASSDGSVPSLVSDCESNIADELLRAECIFLVSDTRSLIANEARTICSKTAPFIEDCLRHAAAREVEQTIFDAIQLANPEPMKLLPRIHGVVRQYLDPQIAESMARDMMLRYQATRVGDVFELSDCKGIPRQLCSQVYIVSSLGSQEQWHVNFEDPWMKSCGTTPTLENARTWGWTSWDPAAQDIVNEAHRQLCQALPDARSPSSK